MSPALWRIPKNYGRDNQGGQPCANSSAASGRSKSGYCFLKKNDCETKIPGRSRVLGRDTGDRVMSVILGN